MSRLRIDTADLVEAAARPEREPNEALEASVERFQQQRFFVERQDARPRLVLSTLDATKRVADVVALIDRAFEDRLEQPALAADRALRDNAALLVSRIASHLRPSQVQIADDVGLRDLVEPFGAEVRQEVRDDLRVTVPGRLQRRVRLAIHGPPFREARDRDFPPVHAGADVELDLVGPPLGGLLVGEPGGLAKQPSVDLLPEVPDPAALPQSHTSPLFSSIDRVPCRSKKSDRPCRANGIWQRLTRW